MAFRIDDDENRIQDLKDQIDQLEVQTFSPEVVARNESTRNTGIETGDSATLNPYPMWIPIRDFGDVGLVTQEIVLNRVDSHVAKMRIIGDTDIAFSVPPPINKMMWFILDVTIDAIGGYTINLLNNILPAGITIDNTANARTVIRFTTTDGGVTYFAEDLTTGGGSGISFPIDFPITFLGTIGSITQIIDFSLSTRHGWKAEFNGDVELAFDNPPTGEIAYAVFKFKQDGTGGHTLTLPVGTINKTTVEAGFLLGANDETGIVIEFFNDTFYAFLETGNIVSGGGGGSGDVVGPASSTDEAIARFDGVTGKLIQNSGITINDSNEMFGVAGIDLDGATALIQGIKELRFFDDDPNKNIQSAADEISYNTAVLDQHSFYAGGIEIARFIESAASVYRLDMLDHSIDNAQDIRFDDTSGATIFAGTDPAIGFDSTTSRLIINVPAGATVFVTENNVIGSTQIGNNSFETNIINALDLLQLGIDVTVPTVPGEFRNDGTDVFVFSGAAVRNMSNIGVAAGGANVFLSNLTSPTDINQSLLPQGGLSLGGTGNIWSAVHVNNVRLGTAGVVSATSNHILGTGTGIDFNVPTASNFDFLVNGSNIGSISSSGALNFSSLTVDLLVHLNNIGAFAGINGDLYLEGSDVKIVSGGIERNVSDIGTGTFLPLAGGTMTGEIDMNNNDIVGVDDIRFNTANMNIISSATILSIDVPSNQTFRIRDGTTTRFTVVGVETRIAGNVSAELGFFGQTPVTQQSVASDTLANLYTALRNYGLIA